MSRWKYVIFCFTLACTGCSGSDTLLILQRDQNAIESEVADNLIMIVDDASAKVYLEQQVPRYTVRLKKLKERITMWDKFADDDKKKVRIDVDKIREFVIKDKGALLETSFDKISEGAAYFRLLAETKVNYKRWDDATKYIRSRMDKLAEQKKRAILEEWRAAGRKGTPQIRQFGEPASGQDVDPEKEWPYLYKAQDPLKELGGGNGKGLV